MGNERFRFDDNLKQPQDSKIQIFNQPSRLSFIAFLKKITLYKKQGKHRDKKSTVESKKIGINTAIALNSYMPLLSFALEKN